MFKTATEKKDPDYISYFRYNLIKITLTRTKRCNRNVTANDISRDIVPKVGLGVLQKRELCCDNRFLSLIREMHHPGLSPVVESGNGFIWDNGVINCEHLDGSEWVSEVISGG